MHAQALSCWHLPMQQRDIESEIRATLLSRAWFLIAEGRNSCERVIYLGLDHQSCKATGGEEYNGTAQWQRCVRSILNAILSHYFLFVMIFTIEWALKQIHSTIAGTYEPPEGLYIYSPGIRSCGPCFAYTTHIHSIWIQRLSAK